MEFDETPVFFVCKNENDYFIGLTIDLDDERYTLTGISLRGLSKMLHGTITLRELMLSSDNYWEIIAGEEPRAHIIYDKSIADIPLKVLPHEGAYLKIAPKDLEAYIEQIDAHLYGEDG